MKFTNNQTEKLEHYLALLKKWQKSINLVSNATIENAWERHIIDSAQLSEHIAPNVKLVDLGSGGGFPALVLAILRPDLEISLVESDERKCAFLRTVSRETSLNVNIINQRIEDFDVTVKFDLITARAFAPLNKLLDYGQIFHAFNPNIEYLLMKGENASAEIFAAKAYYNFGCHEHDSQTNSLAKILHIKNVSRETF